jgi:hypothetical protein
MTAPTAQQVFDKAFAPGRAPRSDAYRQGVMACLRVRLDGEQHVVCPFQEGTAESDAYFAGIGEGRELAPVGKAPVGFDGPVAMTF